MFGLALSLLLALAPARAGVVDRVAAVVNDKVVTLSEVYELGSTFIEQQAEKGQRRSAELEVLDTLIQRRLITQEVERLGMDPTEPDVDRAIDEIARRNTLDRDTLRTEVERSGMTWTQYRAELRESLREQQFTSYIVRTRIAVDDDQLRDAYRRMQGEKTGEEVVHLLAFVRLLPEGADEAAVAAVLAQASAGAARVNAGEPFALVASELDQASFGAQGGEMGKYSKGELSGPLDEAAFLTAVGAASAPILTDRGVFVLYPIERGLPPLPPFEELRDDLQNRVYSTRIEDEIEQWTQSARRAASIEVKLQAQ